MATNPHNLEVGSSVWRFGRGDTPDVVCIVSETSRSWVLSDGQKVLKSHAAPVFDVSPNFGSMQRYCLTRDAANAMLLERHRWSMADAVTRCTDVATLRAVATALGMPTGLED